MADITHALEAKSDQLNATDLIGFSRIIKIRDVHVKKGEQPVSVFFDGDHNKPWKPSKGMLRVLSGSWGQKSENWIGKSVEIYCCPDVLWAGKPVGGIRIKSISDIDPKGLRFPLAISKQKRESLHVPLLVVKSNQYPSELFENMFDVMVNKMRDGEMTLQAVIARCQETGELSSEQVKRLEESAPIEIPSE